MAGKNFASPSGSFNTSHAADRDPRQSGKPSAGISNESRGNLAPKGPGQGKPGSNKRIR